MLFSAILLGLPVLSFGLIDVTTQLYNRTIYARYRYSGFNNRWIGPYGDSDIYYVEYDGYLRDVYRDNVYDPQNKVRLEVIDCKEGFACLRTRWRDDTSSANTRYLQADWLDVDFEYSSSPYTDYQVQWQILCTSATFEVCYLGSRYYPDSSGFARIWATDSYTLDTDWVTDNPSSWYEFELLVTQASSLGFIRQEQTPCNLGTSNADGSLTVQRGIASQGFSNIPVTDSIVEEVESGFVAGLRDSAFGNRNDWLAELASLNNGFQAMTEAKVNITVKPKMRNFVIQLEGEYGPYRVKTTYAIIQEEGC